MRWSWKISKAVRQNGQSRDQYRWADDTIQKYFPAVRKYANLFSDRLNRLPKKQSRILVACFFCIGTGAFVYVGFRRDTVSMHRIKPSAISQPAYVVLPDQDFLPADSKNSTSYQNIVQFKYYIDSLSKTSEGRRIVDSLYSRHPGVFDSLTLIDKVIGLP